MRANTRNTQGWGGSEEENQRCGDRDKHEVLEDGHRLLQPALYLEIGVDEGRSLSRARGPALGLDPRPGLTLTAPLHAQARLLTTSSDAFFRDQAERLLAMLRQGRDAGWSVAQVREGLSAFRSGSSHKSSSQAPHAMTKTLLYGAFGRHNFGDLLFPWIIEKIFAQYGKAQHLVRCDLLSRDMRRYGGHRVNSIGRYVETQEPLNVISVGGEIGGCPVPLALWFFEPTTGDIDEIQVLREQPGMEYGYLLSKSDFKEPGLFVANSIGGYSDGVLTKYRDYDFIGFRDQPSQQKAREAGLSSAQLVPDCAVLTRYFFEEKIQERGTTDQISRLRNHCGDHYVAVQLKANVVNAKTAPSLRTQLQRIQSETGWPIVFFRAGAAPGHDALSAYISYLMDCLPSRSVYLFDGLNVWDICHVIANAHCVIGTSLHVRIISMIYARPRVTLFASEKVKAFVDKWDNEKTISLAPETLSDCVQQALSSSIPEHDVKNTQALIDEYFSKSSWIELF
ncbi:MAG: polysaccharide pyruvyl transferase family protein [Chromatiaceae bacterium]|nr:polysaccharide pyruvyl transferase family protein [Chromatiaceae bacterium]